MENKQQEKFEEKTAESEEKKEVEVKTEKKEAKPEEKKEEKKPDKVEKPEKTEAVVYGKDLSISTKQAKEICRFIKGKKCEDAITLLEQVVRKKKAIPFRGEIAHKKGKRMMSGKYPVKAAKIFIKLIKNLAANASVNDIENGFIQIAKADRASRPGKRFGGRFKRSHVFLKLKKTKERSKKKEIKKEQAENQKEKSENKESK